MGHPVVSVIGRPNVGKSSLFNRILGRRKALVQDTPGVTRDRNYAIAELGGRSFILCDTGGFEEEAAIADGRMAMLIREQALVAIEEADVVVFVMDIRDGLTPADEDIARRLRSVQQPVLWVLNKCDHASVEVQSADFYKLGVDELLLVSAEHGVGLADLVDRVLESLPGAGDERGRVPDPLTPTRRKRGKRDSGPAAGKGGRLQFLGSDMPEEATTGRGPAPHAWDPRRDPDATLPSPDEGGGLVPGSAIDERGVTVAQMGPSFADVDATRGGEEVMEGPPPGWREFALEETDDFIPRIALLGRPNVGKSTMLNRLLGYQRSITSPEAGTTHDTVDAFLEHEGRRYVLIDTAGVRRRSRIVERVEKLMVGRALRTVEAAHLCLLLVDASEGVTEQEARLGALIADRGRALVVLVNKWDLRPKGQESRRQFISQIRRRFPHLAYADVLFVSALTGRGVHRIWDAVTRANDAHRLTIRTAPLNRWARGAWELNPPPMHRHRPVRLYYCAQAGVRPPSFVFFCNQPKALPDSYKRYLANQLRSAFPAPGSPIKLIFKDRSGN
jgi:GTPase